MRTIWLGIGSLAAAAALAGAAFRYGMYFDERFYRWEWPLCLGGAAVAAGCAIRTRIAGGRGEWFVGAPAALGLLLLALLYALALLREPASVLGTLQQALRYAAYAAFALLLHAAFGARERRAWLEAALQASGLAVAGYALAGWLGFASFPSMILTTADARVSAVGARLAGSVQYPNFLGTIAAAYGIWSVLQLARAGSESRFGLYAAGAMPYLLAGLLTESRGAWLAAAAAWAAGCALLKGRERAAWLLYGGWTALCGAAAYRAVVAAGLRGAADGSGGGASAPETALLLLLCAASPAGLYALRRLVRRGGERRLGRLAWPGLAVLAAASAALLPPAIHGRIAGGGTGGGTAGARALFYRDAWTLIREAPLLGRGGDAWRSLFRRVQSQPYVGSEVHSGYAELALDLGAAGLLAGAAALALLLRPVWRGDRAGLLPIGVLLAHALIDFDMSFGYYWLLLGGWSVYYASGGERRTRLPGLERGRGSGLAAAFAGAVAGGAAHAATAGGEPAPEARRASGGRPLPASAARESRSAARRLRLARRARAAVLAAACACFAAAAALGWRFDAAVRHREAAAAVSGAARAAALRAALEANPYWTRIRLELAPLAPPRERAALLAAGLRREPQSVPLLWALGRLSAERGDVRGAAAFMRRALALDRFDRGKQTEAVVTMARLARAKRSAARFAEARLAAGAAEAFYAGFEALDRRYAANGRRFAVTPDAAAAAEQSRLLTARLAPDAAAD